MRQIKFRAWDGDKMYYPGDSNGTDALLIEYYNNTGKMAFVYLGERDERDYESWVDGYGWFHYEGLPLTLMQFTGLVDANGKEIYEGDIIEQEGTQFRVYWNEDALAWYITANKGDEFGPYGGPLLVNTPYHKKIKRTVVGNIYENLKLFKPCTTP